MMKELLERLVEEGFCDLQSRLLERIEATLGPVAAWLQAEQEAERQRAPSRDQFLDEAVVQSLLKEVRQRSTLGSEEQQRIETLRGRVDACAARIRQHPPRPLVLPDQDCAETIRKGFEEHFGFYAGLFRDLRALDLELRGGYDPAVHDSALAAFSWKNLTNREMDLVPPLVAVFDADRPFARSAALALELFGASLPVKLVALQRHVHDLQSESGRAMAHQIHADLGFFGLGLRTVYVLQATEAVDGLDQELLAALKSPRPALLSLWESPRGQAEDARLALESRAFPYLRYDPDLGLDFRACLSIEKNPEPTEPWILRVLPLPGGGEEELPLTFAEFAWQVEGLKDQFESLSEAGLANPSLADYLEMEAEERRHLSPYILVIDQQEPLALVPSKNLLYRCQDKMRLWACLQSLAAEPQAEGQVETAARPEPQDLERLIAEERNKAVAEAMQTLSLKLLGLKEMGLEVGGEEISLDLSALAAEGAPAAEAPEAAPAAEAPAGPADLPWIESKLCTTCDECTNINRRIFAYNKDKQAVIKNPRGGPFRDIVKAAEKCSARIIHPGKPQDPNEKDLPKWVKRAQKYQ